MPRDTARKIENAPELSHLNVKRDDAGAVQTTQLTTGVTAKQTTTGTTTVSATKVDDWVNFISAKVTLKASNTSDVAKLTANGTTTIVNTTAGTGTATSSLTGVTQDPPLKSPTFNLVLAADGASNITGTVNSLTMDDKWV